MGWHLKYSLKKADLTISKAHILSQRENRFLTAIAAVDAILNSYLYHS